jgi:hypothetical protein
VVRVSYWKKKKMTRFTDEAIQCLKETMQKRMPACYFMPEDVATIKDQTGLSESQMLFWAANLRARFSEVKDKEAFLSQMTEVLLLCLNHILSVLNAVKND